jgi:penicillin-binding protein 1A
LVATIAISLALAGATAFGGLLVATPSASEAIHIVRAQAQGHSIEYPGPRLPPRFTEALVATEDHRFYSPIDPGIDPFAVVRVILGHALGLRDQGGSTIEQQLAKMLYTPGRSGYATVDLVQIAIAIKLNFTYTKTQILSMYAEVAYFGNGYYGLSAASLGYFGQRPEDLTWAQAAMLAGVVNAPTADNPRLHPARARAREIHVFRRLVAVGDLTKSQAEAALSRPLGLVTEDNADGSPPRAQGTLPSALNGR